MSAGTAGILRQHCDLTQIAGCARGIGNDLAKHLDKKGFHVFSSCRDPKSPGAEDLRKSCSSRLQVFQLDAANDESVQKAVQFVKDNLSTREIFDGYTPFREVNIHMDLKKKSSLTDDFVILRLFRKTGTLSKEKVENLKEQLCFIPDQHKFYEHALHEII
ncbi:hypothetical protein AVEN_23421-1 [Araneus ventricosus]|uniref:Uncharacterized protein n=1 Tax=Araneus ventricosus TaxID=182803 RepID=A0A4Y2E9A4_ARAVE|nr:hypothetical protein AVEN_23421-1 [Araneus ventricosus]